MFQILFLCPGNAARSILAEAIFNAQGAGRVKAWSAGSNSVGIVHPAALRCLALKGLPISGLRSKGWAEFNGRGAPDLHAVVSLCPSIAAETAPTWPGAPVVAEWSVADPMAAPAGQVDLAFLVAYHQLATTIGQFLALPFTAMDRHRLGVELARIGPG